MPEINNNDPSRPKLETEGPSPASAGDSKPPPPEPPPSLPGEPHRNAGLEEAHSRAIAEKQNAMAADMNKQTSEAPAQTQEIPQQKPPDPPAR